MGNIEKLKSRSEWQAYIVTIVTLFLNHFLGWEMSGETLMSLVASSGAYGISRGMAKNSKEPEPSAAKAPQAGSDGGDGG